MELPWIWAGAAIVVVVWLIWVFNALVSKRNQVTNAWSDIDVQLKKRHDLIPNLVAAVQGFKGYEAALLQSVTQARAAAMAVGAQNVAGLAAAESHLTSAVHGLLVAVEAYPDIKASGSFLKLQDQLAAVENDLESARRYYNATVREFNSAVQVFPTTIFARWLGFTAAEFFAAETNEKANVAVTV